MKGWLRTLVFYVTAFLANALLLVSTVWLYLRATEAPSEPGDTYYGIVELLPAILSIVPATLCMWLLRRLARRFAWRRWWQWALAGTAGGFTVIWGLGRLGLAIERTRLPLEWQSAKNTVMFLLLDGPLALSFLDWWLPLPALAAAASLLFLLQKTFGWQNASKQ